MINGLRASPSGLKVVLDFCEVDLLGPQDVADEPSKPSETVQVKPSLW